MKHYPAPWDKTLILMSVFATVVCLAGAFTIFKYGGQPREVGWLIVALIPGSALFTVRGYTITPEAILMQRLLWATRLPRAGLQSVEFVPDAMRRSIRTCGNGGFFSFTGFYRNKTLGAYRAYVTDRHQTVVLRYPERTVVVSPASPEEFARELAVT